MSDVVAGLEQVDSDLKQMVARVTRTITYSEVLPNPEDGRVPRDVMPLERFTKLRSLAVLDKLSELNNAAKAEALGISSQAVTGLRKDEQYGHLCDVVVQRLQEMSSALTMGTASKMLEPIMVEESLQAALFGSGGVKSAAVESFIDRTSAKKGRGGDIDMAHGSAPINEKLLEAMTAALEVVQRTLPEAATNITPPRGDTLQLPDGGTYDGEEEHED